MGGSPLWTDTRDTGEARRPSGAAGPAPPTPAGPGSRAGKAQKRCMEFVATSPPGSAPSAPCTPPPPLVSAAGGGTRSSSGFGPRRTPAPGEPVPSRATVTSTCTPEGRRGQARSTPLWPRRAGGVVGFRGTGLCGPYASSVSHPQHRAGNETHDSSLFCYWKVFRICSSTVCCVLGSVTGPETQPRVRGESTRTAAGGGPRRGRRGSRRQRPSGAARPPRGPQRLLWASPAGRSGQVTVFTQSRPIEMSASPKNTFTATSGRPFDQTLAPWPGRGDTPTGVAR